jgi:hypothetical protein
MHFYQIEAINLDSFVYDTHDNRAIRGGSFLLLDAIERLAQAAKSRLALEVIQTGGSQALLRGHGEPEPTLQWLREELVLLEKQKPALVQASFALAAQPDTGNLAADLAAQPDTGNLAADLAALQNRIREAQLRQPAVWFVPDEALDAKKPCAENGLLPGTRPDSKGGNEVLGLDGQPKRVSESVQLRRERGRDLRRGILERYTGLQLDLTDDLEELATNTEPRDRLDGKIALFYADGNAFGKLRAAASTVDQRKDFARRLDEIRDSFLRALARTAQADPSWRTKEDRLRLETLMVGGDEMLIAVPAWCGWQTLRLFFDTVADAEFKGQPMTWSAGLVFCHHKAPLLGVRKLAEDLADQAKQDGGRTANACHTLVMESFDGLPRGVASYFADYLNLGHRRAADLPMGKTGADPATRWITAERLLLLAEHLDEVESRHRTLDALARSQVYKLVRRIHSAERGALVQELAVARDNGGRCPDETNDSGLVTAYRPLLRSAEGERARRAARDLLLGLQTLEPLAQLGIWTRQVELMDYIRPAGREERR